MQTFHISFKAANGGRCLLQTKPLDSRDADTGLRALEGVTDGCDDWRKVRDTDAQAHHRAPVAEARASVGAAPTWNESGDEA